MSSRRVWICYGVGVLCDSVFCRPEFNSLMKQSAKMLYLFFVYMAGFMMSIPSVRLTLTMGRESDSNNDRLLIVIVLAVVHWMGLSADEQDWK